MPFIPYALALSLSVEYRKWRYSKTPMFQKRAKKNFVKIHHTITDMSQVWTSAAINSRLADAVIFNLAKAGEKLKRTPAVSEGQNAAGTPHTEFSGHASDTNVTGDSVPPPSTASETGYALGTENCQSASYTAGAISGAPEMPGPPTTFPNPTEGRAVGAVPQPSPSLATPYQYDSSSASFDGSHSFSDVDLFQLWDPDLTDEVNFSFGSNLDPAWPLAWTDYSNYGKC